MHSPEGRIGAWGITGIGVPGTVIEALSAGPAGPPRPDFTQAITSLLDSANHPETLDFVRAAPHRALCARLGEDPAVLAHRCALSLPGVVTVVLGVKNRAELDQCLRAEADAPLSAARLAEIDGLGPRN